MHTTQNEISRSFRMITGIAITMTSLLTAQFVFAENETIYNPVTGEVVMPLVVIGDDKGRIPAGDDITRYRVILQQDSDGSFRFTLVDAIVKEGILDKEVEKYLGIERGVYGQTILRRDGIEQYADFGGVSAPDPANPEQRISSGSDRNGFHQLELPPGIHEICFEDTCRPITVAESGPGELHRCDVLFEENTTDGSTDITLTCTPQP